MPAEINLLRTKTEIPSEVAFLTFHLKWFGFTALTIVLAAGIIISSLYIYLQLDLSSLVQQKRQLIMDISRNSQKESFLRIIKEEVASAGKVMKTQKQWAGTLEMIEKIATTPTISSISFTDKQELLVNLKLRSIEEAAAAIGAIVAQTTRNNMKNPILREFGMNADGTIKMSISFNSLL